MSSRLDKSWKVLASPSTASVDRCVDIFLRPDGTFGFEEFRRDPEDGGVWTPVDLFLGPGIRHRGRKLSLRPETHVPWLGEVLDAGR